MKTIELHETADESGVLHLEIPVEQPNHRYRVFVIIPDEETTGKRKAAWPPGFIENTAGRWIGEFDLGSEGGYEERKPL